MRPKCSSIRSIIEFNIISSCHLFMICSWVLTNFSNYRLTIYCSIIYIPLCSNYFYFGYRWKYISKCKFNTKWPNYQLVNLLSFKSIYYYWCFDVRDIIVSLSSKLFWHFKYIWLPIVILIISSWKPNICYPFCRWFSTIFWIHYNGESVYLIPFVSLQCARNKTIWVVRPSIVIRHSYVR